VDKTIFKKTFQEKFGGKPIIVRAPGRINFIGEHTDYNNGLVLPAAIDREIFVAVAPNHTAQCQVFSPDLNESHSFSVDELNPGKNWVHYLQGVMHGIRQAGYSLSGANVMISGNIPAGAGLSSSAALCCGFGMAYSHAIGASLTKLALAKIAQYAEHHFAGVKCGLMDQYASLFGMKDLAILLDCKTLEHEYVPFQFPDIDILLIDTKVKHSLADSAYNNRREACEMGVKLVSRKHEVHSLRDVSVSMLMEMKSGFPEDIFRRCQYVVNEMRRTRQAVKHLKENNIQAFGSLLFETHWGLSRDYEVSCGESDFLVDLAQENKSVLGARMMGGGFGGCTLNLVKKNGTAEFREAARKKYFATFKKEPDFYSVSLEDGVTITSDH